MVSGKQKWGSLDSHVFRMTKQPAG